MAEILLSLTIIGVVAAITLPSLTGNINERTWNTQRKALYARMSQAISLMPALNGYGQLKEESSSGAGDAIDTATETFITDGLSKVLKINNICDNTHLADCGIVANIYNIKGSRIETPTTLVTLNNMFNGSYIQRDTEGNINAIWSYSQIDTKAAAFETSNGESILAFYNPNCVGAMGETSSYYSQPKMCANFIYDLNGNKGPNTVGKDIGVISVLYPIDSVVVAPVPQPNNISGPYGGASMTVAGKECRKDGNNELRLPNVDELTSIFYNRLLFGINAGDYWSSTVGDSPDRGYFVRFASGLRAIGPRSAGELVRCVKR